MGTQRYKIVMLPTQKANGGINVQGLHFKQEFYILDKTIPIPAKSPFYNGILNNIQVSPFNQESEETENSLQYAIIASTDNIGLHIPQYIINAYIADNNIELSIDNAGNFCYDVKPTLEEVHQEFEKLSELQVDFDLLNYTFNELTEVAFDVLSDKEQQNLALFVTLLKSSKDFAIIAHQELSKRN